MDDWAGRAAGLIREWEAAMQANETARQFVNRIEGGTWVLNTVTLLREMAAVAAVPAPRPAAEEMGTAPDPADPGSSTAAQRLEIVTALSDLGIYGRAARLRLCSDLAGRMVASPLELSFVEAGAVLANLAMRKAAPGAGS